MISMGLEETRALSLARGSGRSLTVLARLIPRRLFRKSRMDKRRLPTSYPQFSRARGTQPTASTARLSNRLPEEQLTRRSKGMCDHLLATQIRRSTLSGQSGSSRADGRICSRGSIHQRPGRGLLREAMLKVFGQLQPEPDPDAVVRFSGPKPDRLQRMAARWTGDDSPAARRLEHTGAGQPWRRDRPRVRQQGIKRPARPEHRPASLDEFERRAAFARGGGSRPFAWGPRAYARGRWRMIRPIFDEHKGFLRPDLQAYRRPVGLRRWPGTRSIFAAPFSRSQSSRDRSGREDRKHTSKKFGRNLRPLASQYECLSAQRLSALNEIAQFFPAVGWRLVKTLLPSWHRAWSRRRSLTFASASDYAEMTYREIWENESAVVKLAIGLAGDNESRWLDLLPVSTPSPHPRGRLPFNVWIRRCPGLTPKSRASLGQVAG